MGLKEWIQSEKIGFAAAAIFAVLLPFDMIYATAAVYPFILVTLIFLRKEKFRRIPRSVWVFCMIFLLSLSGYFYTQNTEKAGLLLERQLTIFAFPFLLPLAFKINAASVRKLMWLFSLSCFAAVSYLFYVCFAFLLANQLPLSALGDPRFYHHNFSTPIHIHAAFLSLYIALCVCFLVHEIVRTRSRKKQVLLTLVVAHLCAGLYFLASRNAIITVIFMLLLVLPFFVKRNRMVFVLVSSLCLGTFLFLGFRSDYIYQRFSKELVGDLRVTEFNKKEYPESRIVRWRCAADIIKRKPVFGHGSGDEIPLLREEYRKHKMWTSYFEEFNTHNQYLAVLLKHGAVGLAIFLGMFGFFFYLAVKSKNFVYLSFLFIITFGFLTENIVDANKGIFFFALFNTLFGYAALAELAERKKHKTQVTS